MCQNSFSVNAFIEEFRIGGETYIVTKFASGGDLVDYLSFHDVDKLPEDRVR